MIDLTAVGKETFDSLLALVPEDKREEARSLYSRGQDQFRSAAEQLAENENALKDWHGRLRGWATTREAEIARKEAELQARGNPNPGPGNPANPTNPAVPPNPTNPQPGGGLTQEQVDQLVAERMEHLGRAFVGASSEATRLQQQHFRLYNGQQDFDPEELYRHPLAKTAGLTAAFNEIHKAKIAEAGETARKAAEDKIRADERAKTIAEMGSNKTLPFPTPGADDSPFGIIERRNADNKEKFGADAATELYRQIRSGQIPA